MIDFTNLMPLVNVFEAFATIYVANILFGIGSNCILNGEKFDWKLLCGSVLKLAMTAFAMFAVFIAFDRIAAGLGAFGLEIGEKVTSVISVGTYVLLLAKGFVQGSKDVYNKIKALFEIKDNAVIDDTDFINMQYTAPDDEVEHEV